MPIHRAEHKKDFTMILNTILNDENLSYGARGLMVHVLTHFDNWVFTGEDYFVTEKDKLSKIKGYLKELIQFGYLRRSQEKGKGGVFGKAIYIFYELPKTDLPIAEKPITVQPSTENLMTVEDGLNSEFTPKTDLPTTESPITVSPIAENQTLNNTNINNTNIYSANDYEEIWSMYPNKKGKAKSIKDISKILKSINKDELIRTIERYKEDVKHQRKNGFKTLNYVIGSTFFNGRYEDYLDCNYEGIIKSNTSKESIPKQYKEFEFD